MGRSAAITVICHGIWAGSQSTLEQGPQRGSLVRMSGLLSPLKLSRVTLSPHVVYSILIPLTNKFNQCRIFISRKVNVAVLMGGQNLLTSKCYNSSQARYSGRQGY